jgi:HrpA-like RNA helicase
MTRPSRDSLTKALEELYTLRALNYNGDLSDIGRLMVYFPLPPAWARMLLKACEPAMDCAVEVAKILSVMSVEGIFFLPSKSSAHSAAEKQTQAQRKQFAHVDGDHFTYLDAFNAFLNRANTSDTRSRNEWCRAHGLNHKNLEKVRKIFDQLAGLARRLNLPFNSVNQRETGEELSNCTETERIKKCLLQGLFMNVARKQGHDASYVTLADSTVVYIHPSSVLIGRPTAQRPELLVFNTLVHTSRAYMRECLSLPDLKWLVELVPEAYGDAAAAGQGGATKIKGGKQAAMLHERLAANNANQSKLTAARASQPLALKGSKQAKHANGPAPTSKTTSASTSSAAAVPPTHRPPKPQSNKKHGGTRADSLMDFVNGL